MTTGGWIMMAISLTVVWGGAFLAFRKVLSSPADEKAPPGFGP